MYTIGQLSKRYNLSRGTLLYYDSIGLLSPSGRTGSNYRAYSDADMLKLEQIMIYRETGISLEEITTILKTAHTTKHNILYKRIDGLNTEIRKLVLQRSIIISMLKDEKQEVIATFKKAFISTIEHAGFSDNEMDRLHTEFERFYPDEHQSFLEYLGIAEDEIKVIRTYARQQITG